MGTGQIKRDIERSLTLIVTGKQSEIAEGWAKLKKFEGNQVYDQANNYIDILRPILRDLFITNVNQIPGIISWYCKNVITTNSDVSTFVSDLTMFLTTTHINDMNDLKKILEQLKDYNILFCKSNNYVELGKAIVESLANLSPPYQPLKNDEFNENAIKIQTLLCEICSNKQVLASVCLKTLYKIISDKNRMQEPALALASVLKLMEPSEEAVDWILLESQCEDELIQALRVLCTWLPNWKGNSLGRWIMEFIFGLERKKKDAILIEVTETMLNIIFSALLEPGLRRNASDIIFPILKRQGSLHLLNIIINIMDKISSQLDKENSKSSRECIHDMTDIKTALMTRFTHSKDYISSQINLPVRPQTNVGKEIIIGPTWTNEKELNSFVESPKSINGKVGLSNLGNTCYMNSVLQALFMTREFCYEVLNYKPFNDNGEQVILKKLQDLFALLLYSNRISLSPNEILNVCRPASFLPGQQQDSSEFLCHLLDMLHEQERCATNDLISYQCKVDIQDSDNLPIEEAGVIKRWTTEENLTGNTILQRKTQSLADFTQGDELSQTQNLSDYHSDSTDSGIQSVGGEEISIPASLVHRVLGGESKITYKCARCNTGSHNIDKFRDLQLCFPEELNENQEAVSVQYLIDYYLAPEKLTGDNKYRCDKCMILCDAERIIKILQAPAHLILTLKHFHYDFESRLKTKLRHKVLYNDIIQLPVSTQPNSITETYQLYAVVVHSGYNMDYGHYFTYACDSKQNWYKFNDSYVSRTSLEDLKNLKAPDTPYILFYEKLGSSDGIYDDKIELSTLSKHIQELVAKDRVAYIEELRHQPEQSQHSRYPVTLFRRSDNSDDENPPFSNCRGPVNIQTNSRLC
ncbi:PREDICTED: ubiquitin carboxyl-terminal hydrolase 35 [Polistes canadensis]|uniref:ubiquitin carboxyl-terminal hydrolase 35 n=1 Tax=Polistes canadensis TaxID=91411 RepID=UPI000718CB5F|nr:PREDICTED: ubiquitin carboxyl-terminal hydrolase 35 [Polistes canadensis]